MYPKEVGIMWALKLIIEITDILYNLCESFSYYIKES